MQITDKSGEGLSRVYGVTVPAASLAEKLTARIEEIRPKMNIKGFRPGKVPAAHVRRLYGKGLMSEVVQQVIDESSKEALGQVRPAGEPNLELQSEIEQVMDGKADLAFDISVDVMPEFEPVDVSTLSLTRYTYEPAEADIQSTLDGLLAANRTYEPRGKTAKAKDGDQILADFTGRIDGEPFEGGSMEGAEIVIGSNTFIPGFEEQLKGAKTGETRTLTVTFPEDYAAAHLAGKAAEFETTIKEVRAPVAGEVDDALAERLGMGDLDSLRNAVKGQLGQQYAGATRFKLKRALLDELDTAHDFPLPPRMVEAEFTSIWSQVQADKMQGKLSEEDVAKSDEDLQAEYRKIAERRVRLGLVLAEIGRRENVQVTDAEVNQALINEARKFPGQERQVFDFYRNNPQAAAQLRAPVYEEKVVDLIVGKAKVADETVDKETLLADDDLPEGYGG